MLHNNEKFMFEPPDAGSAAAGRRTSTGGAMLGAVLDTLADRFRLAFFSVHLAPNMEVVHHLRATGRLLRVALRAGEGILSEEKIESTCNEIKWLHGQLGVVRELDVLTDDVLAPLRAAYPQDRALAALAERVRRERLAAAKKLQKAVDSTRSARLLAALDDWQKAGFGPMSGRDQGRPARRVANAALDRAHARVRKALGKATGGDLAELHAARKSVKRFGDLMRLFAFLYPRGMPRPLRAAVGNLRDGLGEIQDADTSVRLVRRLLRGRGSALNRAGNLVLGYEARRLADAQRRFPRLNKAFKRAEKFWN
jgi:CHAD domain-containing protein